MLRRRWRRRVLPRLAVVLLPVTLGTLALSVLASGVLAWMGAVWFGVALGFWFYAADAAPPHIQRWAAGAEGERRTGRALRRLERLGWHAVHDLDRAAGGNVDHLVIGPAGVFVLDSKAWGRLVRVDSRGATVTPRDNPEAAWTETGRHRALPGAATAVARALAAASRRALPAPRPVVVLWSAFPQRVATSGPVTYVAGEHLADWLLAQPRQLHPEQAAALTAAVDSQLLTRGAAPATAAPAGAPPPARR